MIRQWRALEPWIAAEDAEHRHSHHELTALREVVTRRLETVTVNGSFGEWSPITVHLDGEISVRDRTAQKNDGENANADEPRVSAVDGPIHFTRQTRSVAIE